MKLTRQMFVDGIDDISVIKIKDFKEFCDAEGFDINLAPRRGKPAIMNDIVELIESMPTLSTNEPETLTASTEPEPEPEIDKIRPNGEVIKLAKDGKDYGSNLMNRIK